MMQQSGELLLLPFPRHSAHAAQSLGHPFPALCRTGCWIARRSPWAAAFPPPPPPKVSPLCSAASSVLRGSPTPPVRTCPPLWLCAFADRSAITGRRSGGLPVLVHVVSRRARVFDHAASRFGSRFWRLQRILPSHLSKQGRHAVRQFSGLNSPAHRCLYLRFAVRLATHHARLEVRIESLLLFCRALSSPTTCRFIPAHSHPCRALSSAPVSTSVGAARRYVKSVVVARREE